MGSGRKLVQLPPVRKALNLFGSKAKNLIDIFQTVWITT